MRLTVVQITARLEPEHDWLFASLKTQPRFDHFIDGIVLVDYYAQACDGWTVDDVERRRVSIFKSAVRFGVSNITKWMPPKPTVWAGPHRLTKDPWWHASCARNTGICACQTEWIAFVDDRSVILPGWLEAVAAAIKGRYVVCGPYEKRTGITVEHGIIRHAGIVTGKDSRLDYVHKFWSDPKHRLSNPYDCPGEWTYGCGIALPLEWALQVNGFDEVCDGSSGEDYIFGLMCQNNGWPIKFDTRMMMIEDRTPEHLGPAMIRRDKGISPADKSHALLNKLKVLKRASHHWDLRRVRSEYLTTGHFPRPAGPTTDWWDGQPLNQMQ